MSAKGTAFAGVMRRVGRICQECSATHFVRQCPSRRGTMMSLNTVKVPTLEQLSEVTAELGFAFTEVDLAVHRECLLPAFEAYNHLDRLPDELPPVTYPRRPGRR